MFETDYIVILCLMFLCLSVINSAFQICCLFPLSKYFPKSKIPFMKFLIFSRIFYESMTKQTILLWSLGLAVCCDISSATKYKIYFYFQNSSAHIMSQCFPKSMTILAVFIVTHLFRLRTFVHCSLHLNFLHFLPFWMHGNRFLFNFIFS